MASGLCNMLHAVRLPIGNNHVSVNSKWNRDMRVMLTSVVDNAVEVACKHSSTIISTAHSAQLVEYEF